MTDKQEENEFDRRISHVTNMLHEIINWLVDALPWFIMAITALLAPIASSSVKDIFEKKVLSIGEPMSQDLLKLNIIYISLFMLSFILLFIVRKHLFIPRTKVMKDDRPEVRPHLILFLSEVGKHVINKYDEKLVPKGLTLEKNGIFSLDSDIQAITDYKEKNRVFWPWEMLMRSIRYHIGNKDKPVLKTITVICSPESIKQFPLFAQFIKGYINETGIELKLFAYQNHELCWECSDLLDIDEVDGIDFESFNELSKSLASCVKFHKKYKFNQPRVKEKMIMIDFTSGNKVSSVVAATISFNSGIKAQYVSTQKPYEIKGYDIVYGTSNIALN